MRMQSIGFCALWLMSLALMGRSNEPKIFCNYNDEFLLSEEDNDSKLKVTEIDPSLCTHLIHSSPGITSDELQTTRLRNNLEKSKTLREKNKELKVLIAVEGVGLSEKMKDPSVRSTLINTLVRATIHGQFDGIIINDASLTIPSLTNYNLHLEEIHATLRELATNLTLGIIVKPVQTDAHLKHNVAHISRYVDFILLIMPVNSPFGTTTTSSISPLYPSSRDTSGWELARNTNATIQYWLTAGASREKLILGTFFGGINYTLENSAEHVPGSPTTTFTSATTGLPITPYNEICQLISQDNWSSVWDAEQRMSYSYAGNQWITYENVRSLTEKAEYAKAMNLGGVLAYSINSDDFRGLCGERYPLLKVLNCKLRGNNCSSETTNQTISDSVLPEAKIVCYYDSTAVNRVGYARLGPSEIDPSNCTHLVYADLGVNTDRYLAVFSQWVNLSINRGKAGFQKFNALRKRNTKLKTLVSTRGWHEYSMTYSKIYANSSLRSQYVNDVIWVVNYFEFDGFFIDWIYPNTNENDRNEVRNFVLLLKEFRTRFDERKLILGITVRGSKKYAQSIYDIPQLFKYVDFVTLVGEYHLPENSISIVWEERYPTTRETSGLDWASNYDASIKYWLLQGAPAEKIVLGVQFVGLSYTLNISTENLLGPPANIPAVTNYDLTIIGYNEICRLSSQVVWTTGWNEAQRVPYSHSGNRWISYDNVRSLFEKGKYAKAMGLGGVMAWTIDYDDHQGECGERYPLLSALNCGFREINCTVDSIPQIKISRTGKPDHADEDAKKTCASLNVKYVRHPQNCARFWICRKINDKEFYAEPFSCSAGLYLQLDTSKVACRSKNLVQCD